MADIPVWAPFYSQAEAPGFAQLVPAISGAGVIGRVSVVDATLSGATVTVPTGTFSDCFGLAVYIQVLETVTGATAFQVGLAGSPTLFSASRGSFGTAAGTARWCPPYSPTDFFWGGDLPVLLTAEGGDFTGGKLRIAAYALGLTPPAS